MKILTPEEQRTLHHRYKNNDLYRQWSPILAQLQRNYNEKDAQTLWFAAEQVIAKLRKEDMYREQEISLLYNELISESSCQTASTIMCIVLTMLMNAVEKGHEEEYFDNEPMCMAIMDILENDTFSNKLMQFFFNRKVGYDGKAVVITPQNPMTDDSFIENMDEVAQREIEQTIKAIMDYTQGLQTFFNEYWNLWAPFWYKICEDTQMMLILKQKNPRTSTLNVNEKMVCNIIGLFNETVKANISVQQINSAISGKNLRSYISNHAYYGRSDSVFHRDQHDKIKNIIETMFCQQKVKH